MVDAAKTPPKKDILVIVFSKTPEKVAHFEFAAKDSNVKIIDIHRLAEGYNVAPENTGERKGNAKQKAEAIRSTIQKLRDPTTTEHQNLIAQCHVLGIAYDPDRIFAMVEDSTFTVSKEVWPYLSKRLKGLVSDELLEKYEGVKDKPGPGAETGPIVAATGGFLRFYNLLRQAHQEALESLGTEHVQGQMQNQCTTTLTQLSDPDLKEHPFEGETSTQLLEIPLDTIYASNGDLVDAYNYVAFANNGNIPISQQVDKYFLHMGPRAQAFGKMQKFFNRQLKNKKPSILAEEKAAARVTTESKRGPKITTYKKDLRERIYSVINRERLLSDVGAEGRVFMPFDPENKRQRHRAIYEFASFVVAKQLIARDMFKPLIVEDDGSWKALLKTLASLANKGMAKDFTPFQEPLQVPGVTHIITSYFDCLRYDPTQYDRDKHPADLIPDEQLEKLRTRQMENLKKARETIAEQRAEGYHEFIPPKQLDDIKSEGTAPDGSRFTVAHFISATSDNQTLIEQSQSLGAHLGETGAGYVWGGMNMHVGGEGFKAYKEAGGKHAAAYSTIPIAAAETEDGTLPPDADYREWSRDIYERMAGMIAASDVIVISPGGWGTFQELMALIVLKEQAPELFANKKIIIHNPAIHDGQEFSGRRFWNETLMTIFNVETRNKDFSSFGDKDVFIANDSAELNELSDRFHVEWLEKHAKPAVLPTTTAPQARRATCES